MKHSLIALFPLSIRRAARAAAAPATKAKVLSTETLSNGVVVEHTRTGTGPAPVPTDVVQVNYRGTLVDGKEFDSSYQRGRPASFPLNGVIPCWTEGLQKMKVGGAATLTCPPQTAYGARGAGDAVPPNATLHFDVELLAIEKK
jgi:FKBP-type peptidyl-prolyl cis-trans isomerase FkpA